MTPLPYKFYQPPIINGRYILHEEIGRGGMGSVYRATDRLTGDVVALKQIKADLNEALSSTLRATTPDALRLAFAQEFQILAGLRHPHIVSVLDYGFAENQEPYFTMTYLGEAKPLLVYAQNRSQDEKLELALQILLAIAYLHRRGVMHKDINPNNILVRDGQAYLLDFGLSASQTQHSALSGGTLQYMSPEVYHQTQPYSFVSDLYSLGAVIYELMMGFHPFETLTDMDRENPIDATHATHATHQIDLGGLTPAMSDFLHILLAKKPEDRYTTQAALEAFNRVLGRKVSESREIRESYLQAATFVGRETERKQLSNLLHDAQQGKGKAVLIGGESGVGKSRLLKEVETKALVDGFILLRGQGVQEGGEPYQLWREPIRHLSLMTELSQLDASILLPLIPDLPNLLNRKIEPAPYLESNQAKERLFAVITDLFCQLTTPVLLVLEDLQWATDSLDILAQLLRNITEAPLLITGTYRTEEAPDLAEHFPQMSHILLERLDDSDVQMLCRSIMGGKHINEGLVAFLQEQSEGNTFFLVEVVRALAEQAGQLDTIVKMSLPETVFPAGIANVLERRLANVPKEIKPLLNIAALVGRQLDIFLLQALVKNRKNLERNWLPTLSDAGLLSVEGSNWQFSHDKLREGLIQQLDPSHKAELHRQIAEGIENVYPDDSSQASALMRHWGHAGIVDKEFFYAQQAGRYAQEQNILQEALVYWNRAEELTADDNIRQRFEVYMAQEAIYNLQANRDTQQSKLAELVELKESLDGVAQGEIVLRQANYAIATSDYDQLILYAQKLILLGEELDNGELITVGQYQWGMGFTYTGSYKDGETHLRIALTGAKELGLSEYIGQCYNGLGQGLVQQGKLEKAKQVLIEALPIQDASGIWEQKMKTLNILGVISYQQREFDQALEYYEHITTLNREMGIRSNAWTALNNLGLVFYKQGDYDQAKQYFQQSLKVNREIGRRLTEGIAHINLGEICYDQEDYVQAKQHYDKSLTISRNIGATQLEGVVLNQLGYLFVAQNEFAQADVAFQEAAVIHQELNQPHHLIEDLAGLAQVRLAQKRPDHARQYISKLLDYLNDNPTLVGAEHPVRAFYVIWTLLKDLGQIGEAKYVLSLAAQVIQTYLDRTPDPTKQTMYLRQPYHHRFWQMMQGGLEQTDRTINGRYILHEEIGRGGMGIVYRATDRLTGDIVAFKQIKVNLDDALGSSIFGATSQELRFAFAQEFQILAGLRHPHIVSVLDYGFDVDHKPYFTMNYLPQATKLVDATENLDLEAKLNLLIQILQSLVYLHRHGILHKDIKPSNILVSNDHAYLIDFGLSATDQNQSALSGGTLLYMAPEVYHQTKEYSFSSELYSFGVVMYQILADMHLFDMAKVHDAQQLFDARYDIDPLKLPTNVNKILQKLLQKNSANRYQSAQQVLNELNSTLGNETVEEKEIRESFLQAAKFVGRKSELDLFKKAIKQALYDEGSAWLIGGESGVGKSRLLSEVSTHALVDGFEVVRGQGIHEGNSLRPFDLWQAPLRHLLISAPDVGHGIASVLMQIVPNISQLLGKKVIPAPKLDEKSAQLRLLVAIADLVKLQPKPVLLILEDIQWADESLLPITELARSINEQALLLVATYRNDERPDLPEYLPAMNRVSLGRLDDQSVAEMGSAMLGDIGRQPNVIKFLQQQTEGNAFFAVELVRALAEEVGQLQNIEQTEILPQNLLPKGIQDIVERRIAYVPGWGQPLLKLAAVVGRDLNIPLLRQLATTGSVIDKWLQVCIDAAILEVHDTSWRFSHDKIRETLLLKITKEEKIDCHSRIAEQMIKLDGDDLAQAATIAYHWQHAQNPIQEQKYASLAGDYAKSQFRIRDAQRHYERAYSLIEPAGNATPLQANVELITNLSAVLFNVEHERSFELARESEKLIRSEAGKKLDADIRANALEILGRTLGQEQQYEEALLVLNEANTIAQATQNYTRQAEILIKTCELHNAMRNFERSEEVAAEILVIAEQLGDMRKLIQGYQLMGYSYYARPEKRDEEIQLNLQVLELARQYKDPSLLAYSLCVYAYDLYLAGKLYDAIEINNEAIESYKEIGNIHSLIITQSNQATFYFECKEFSKGWDLLQDNSRLVEGRGFQDLEFLTLLNLAQHFVLQDRYVEAIPYLDRAEAYDRPNDPHIEKDFLECAIQTYEALDNTEKVILYQQQMADFESRQLDNSAEAITINGRYILHEEIGRGGTGVVYRATDQLTSTVVALKQIKSPPDSQPNGHESYSTVMTADMREAFAQEFRVFASLRHPHIVSVLDYGFDEQQNPYFTMELLSEAVSLDEAAGELSLDAKTKFVIQVLEALSYLHKQGLLHRDIKPSNILVNQNRAYLTDFGLATTGISRAIISGGTQLYMDPKVYQESRPYDIGSDLYSLGIVIYQMLAGNFSDSTPTASEDYALTNRLNTILQKLLQTDPNQRFKSAQQVLNKLRSTTSAIGSDTGPEHIEMDESYLQTAAFVGRKGELSQLQSALADTKKDQADSQLERVEQYVDQTIFLTENSVVEKDETRINLDSATPILGRLLEISNHMAEIRALDPLLSYAINEVLNLVGAERGYIVLINDDNELEFRVKQRADGSQITSKTDPISHSILDEVVRTSKGLIVRNALLDPRFATAVSVVAMRLRSIMCAPLITKNKIIGAIYVENRARSGQFTEEDLLPLEFFSNQAAISIENAYINDNLEKLVIERTRELADAKDLAEAANEAKTSFLSNMSHELRTPLNSIINFTGFVFDRMFGEINEDQHEALEQVLDSGEHLLSLINDILDINKIEAGMMQLIIEDIDVNKLINNTVGTTKGLIRKKQLRLDLDIASDLPTIQADRRRARQIMLNVIANAVKYTLEGFIRIEAKQQDESILIVIEDSGIGIAEEEQENVFETFVEARHSLTNVLSTGLGLSITKNLVELHNGRIWFDSEPGRGSIFYIQLPIQQP